MHASLIQTLGLINCAVFQRQEDQRFTLLEGDHDWLKPLFEYEITVDTYTLEDKSIFLDDFMIDAVDFWENSKAKKSCNDNQIKSGIWTEITDGGELYLEAIAAIIDRQQILVINNVAEYYSQQKETLQIARELLISNDEIVERHDYLSERIRSILIETAQSGLGLPLHQAIKHADIGVIITNENVESLEINPAARDIFDCSKSKSEKNILVIIESLIKRQHHNTSEIFNHPNPWSGELYWHAPPTPQKWLKLNINPVFNDVGKVSYWVFTISDITRIKYLLQTNEDLALHDPLTGLPNRQYFWQELQKQIKKRQAVTLLSIDIVNFRSVNELYGYLDGDELLNQMVKRTSAILTNGDFMTRVGADEFMILRRRPKGSNENEYEQSILRLSDEIVSMSKQALFTKSDRKCVLPVKIGVSHFPLNAINAEELISCADLALASAKKSMSKDIVVYSEKLKQASQRRLFLENALKNAIEQNQLEVFLQPIFDIESKEIIKAEALLRWHLNGETISPVEFIPIAERSDLINTIGRWVFATVCDIQVRLSEQGVKLPITVNFSPKQIYDLHLINFFRHQIEEHHIDPDLLELEVTEGVLINNYNKVKLFLEEIKDTGIHISVDDFGTGYCSLSYLKHLPIDTLKIDRSFIEDIDDNEDDRAIVNAIIAMAHSLNLSVIAEGVETQAQQQYLIDHKCHIAQGFMYGRPMPVTDFIANIQNNNQHQGKH